MHGILCLVCIVYVLLLLLVVVQWSWSTFHVVCRMPAGSPGESFSFTYRNDLSGSIEIWHACVHFAFSSV